MKFKLVESFELFDESFEDSIQGKGWYESAYLEYKRLLDSGKISSEDAKKVEDMIGKFNETEDKLNKISSELGVDMSDISSMDNLSQEDLNRFLDIQGEYLDKQEDISHYLYKLVEENNDKVSDSNVQKYIKEYIYGMSTNDIVKESNALTTSNPTQGATFILPNGDMLYGIKSTNAELHQDILREMCENILSKKTKTNVELTSYANLEELYNHLIENLGWIKMNTGIGASDNRCYAVIPSRKGKRPTPSQFDTLEDELWLAYESGKFNATILEGMSASGAIGRYFLKRTSPEETIKSIKNFYSGGSLIYEGKLNEVYPNKGESKKDFIARFMKVTKDEYPDIKQRYAIALSYWDRRNKKKVNESVTKIDSNKSKATTKDGREFTIWTETNDSHGGELYKMKIAYVGDNWIDENDKVIKDNLLGYVDYNVYEDKAYINFIKVKDSEKRKGVGTALIQSLYDDHKEVIWGYTTEEGSELKKYIDSIK